MFNTVLYLPETVLVRAVGLLWHSETGRRLLDEAALVHVSITVLTEGLSDCCSDGITGGSLVHQSVRPRLYHGVATRHTLVVMQ